MSAMDRARRVGRRGAGRIRRAGRRFLAVPRVRRVAVALADRAPFLRTAGNAVLGPVHSTRRPVLDVRPGRMFVGGVQGRALPIVVIVAVDLPAGAGEDLAREVEHAQLGSGTFRPVVVIDSGDLAAFRRRGHVVEAVMPRATFEQVNPQDSWSEYLYERVNAIVAAYGATSVVPWTTEGWARTPRHVLRLMGALGR
jgi:hypothetical protein